MAMTVSEYQFLSGPFLPPFPTTILISYSEDWGLVKPHAVRHSVALRRHFSYFFGLMWLWPERYCFFSSSSAYYCDSKLHKTQLTKKKAQSKKRAIPIKIRINRNIQKANMTNKKINKQSGYDSRLAFVCCTNFFFCQKHLLFYGCKSDKKLLWKKVNFTLYFKRPQLKNVYSLLLRVIYDD